MLVAHERPSCHQRLSRQPNKAAQPGADRLLHLLENLPPRLRRTVTFDNGTEFAEHYQLTQRLGVKTFFCDAHKFGRKAASKTPSVAGTATYLAKPTSPPCGPRISRSAPSAATTPH